MALQPDQVLSHYRLVEIIGEGGMGVVWKAMDTRLDRAVAIKVLTPDLSEDPHLRDRFEREARVISRLSHPHICTLYDIGRQDGLDFLVMELLEGEALVDRLRQGALPVEQALRFAVEIAGALDEAHRAGLVHRDLKPANVMLTRHGSKLLDFGLAKLVETPTLTVGAGDAATATGPLTETGTILGTVPYMAPEQLDGGEVDARTDIFALGSVLYEMVTGERPFVGDSTARLIGAILHSEPPPVTELQPAAPPLLDHLIRRCLAKDPDARWQSARELADELEWIAGPPATETPAKRPPTVTALMTSPTVDHRILFCRSDDGASIAVARGGAGRPLLVVPTMVDTVELSWSAYRESFPNREVILYDRRGTGLSERGNLPETAEPFLQDARAVVKALSLEGFDVLGSLMGTVEAATLAADNPDRVDRLVLRAPVTGMADWASIPAVRAALATLDHDWEYFTESFSQLVLGWGSPKGPHLAARYRSVTTREELRDLLRALATLDLTSTFPRIRAATVVEHHPGYFFPNSYSRRIASMIPDCRLTIFSGVPSEFLTDLTNAREFLEGA